jgi:hypothetical protein
LSVGTSTGGDELDAKNTCGVAFVAGVGVLAALSAGVTVTTTRSLVCPVVTAGTLASVVVAGTLGGALTAATLTSVSVAPLNSRRSSSGSTRRRTDGLRTGVFRTGGLHRLARDAMARLLL